MTEKYYEVIPTNSEFRQIVLAGNKREAKEKFKNDQPIPYFEGWDNSDWPDSELSVIRRPEIDQFSPEDNFNIIKTLILKCDWNMMDVDDAYKTLTKENYTDEKLRHYLHGGEVLD